MEREANFTLTMQLDKMHAGFFKAMETVGLGGKPLAVIAKRELGLEGLPCDKATIDPKKGEIIFTNNA